MLVEELTSGMATDAARSWWEHILFPSSPPPTIGFQNFVFLKIGEQEVAPPAGNLAPTSYAGFSLGTAAAEGS